MTQLSMDRRSFVVGAAAIGAAGAVAGSLSVADRAQAEEAHEAAVTSYYESPTRRPSPATPSAWP